VADTKAVVLALEAVRLTLMSISRRLLALEAAASGETGQVAFRVTMKQVADKVELRSGQLMQTALHIAGVEAELVDEL
jgi:hypothetical protein